MKYFLSKSALFFMWMLSIIYITSCKDDWDEHYKADTYKGADISLIEYINSRNDLSIFAEMLKSTGYDSILNTSVSYTVWAPGNDGLAGIDLNNEVMVKNIVENHIAKSRISTSGISLNTIQMMNGKYVEFERSGGMYTFGKSDLIVENEPARNGLAHVLSGYAPYLYNVWEYIGNKENLDSLKKYLYGKDELVFDPENSIEIGYDGSGNAIYDSVFIYNNDVLNYVGELFTEDSIYTAILPDNTAWIEAYDRITSYFNFPDVYGGAERKDELTKFTLVKDMVYKQLIQQNEVLDSVVSTTGNVIYNPSYLFENGTVEEVSNGLVYLNSQMPVRDTASWYKKIKVEGENADLRENSNCNIFNRNSYGSELEVSKSRYILVQPTSTTTRPSVTFYLPDVLSAGYNIYCQFVPESITDPTNELKSRVYFYLNYINTSTGRTRRMKITPVDNIIQANGLTKMLVSENFQFPYANVIDEDYDQIAIRLEVWNDVTNVEATAENPEFTRDMRIDCIILEPVAN